MAYATFGDRFIAFLIDAVLIAGVWYVLSVPLFITIGIDEGTQSRLARNTRTLCLIAASVLYHTALDSSRWQGTVGKQALGIKIVDLAGRRISWSRAMARSFASLLSMIVIYMGYLAATSDRQVRTWHDRLAKTLVVKR